MISIITSRAVGDINVVLTATVRCLTGKEISAKITGDTRVAGDPDGFKEKMARNTVTNAPGRVNEA